MRTLLFAALALATTTAGAQIYVPPTVDRNGNYREGHYRSAPDQYRSNNLNAEHNQYGGTNPYTGQRGHQRDEYSSPPQYNQSYGQRQQQQPRQRNAYGY